MKVIDLLNKIANGEQPNKIKYQNKIYFKSGMNYVNIDECLPRVFMQHIFENSLNDEVEIIEEDKKIPEKFRIKYEIDEENTINMKEATMLECDLACKINEIIDYLEENK